MIFTAESVGQTLLRSKCERKLRYYFERIAWPVVEPKTTFVGGWHIDAMCDHAQAVVEGHIRDLLITVAPRHGKSLVSSVAMPTWAWTRWPELRFLFASFSETLSTEHAVLSRRILDSQPYQALWSSVFKLQTDQNIKTHYENTVRGYRIATSVGGTVVGRGGDILVLDDPNNLKTIDSQVARQEVLLFYKNVWSQRFNNPQTGRRMVIMQRGHTEDLAGYLIEQGGWVHLDLPTEYIPTPWVEVRGAVVVLGGQVATEAERDEARAATVQAHVNASREGMTVKDQITVNPLGWRDPRTVEGELMNPGRFGPEAVAKAKRDLGPMGYATQHQQRPRPSEVGLFKRHKLKVITAAELPQGRYAECRGWDQAATQDEPGIEPDWTVGVRMRRYASGLYVVVHVVRGRFGPSEGDDILVSTSHADGPKCRIREEQEGGSSGKKVIASHARLLERYDYKGLSKHVNKPVYAKPFATRVDAGDVVLLEGEWNEAYIDELVDFPNGKHDDQVDGSATAFNDLAENPVSTLSASEVLAIGSNEEDSVESIRGSKRVF